MKDKRFIFSKLLFLFLFFSILLSFFSTNLLAQSADEILKMSPSGYAEDFANVIDDEKLMDETTAAIKVDEYFSSLLDFMNTHEDIFKKDEK